MSDVDENIPLWREESTVGARRMAATVSSFGQKTAGTPCMDVVFPFLRGLDRTINQKDESTVHVDR